ncbi:uncharacterized protein [Populus alba]|uniref:INO80 complex subunit B-like conserved region domain-containing protein n=2 Tax=Populus TaxID=3689 RepID=A0A4U5PZF1_POPAL|nr:uncharacterized protein LOC118062465 [Populus alba]KAJ6987802.1 hypothetical protein NC653_020914 [Populus alba x Populus x berolinensis]TKS03048.1 hypothetical protein D5086_0000158390 [Populus alba]
MENLNGTHSAGLGSTIRKKRSIISRRPCSDLQKFLRTSTLLSSSTQFLNCGHNEEQVASGSDGLRSEKRLKKLKLKFGGVTHTIHAKPATEYAFNGGSSLTKSYQGFDASRSREKLLVQDSSFRKGNSSGRKMSSESVFVNGTSHFEAVRKSNRVPKRCAMDVEFDEDGDIDEEVRYLGRLNAYKERRRGVSMVSDGRQEDKDFVQEEEPTSEDEPGYPSKRLGYVGGRNESTTTAHKRARQTAKDDFLVPGASLLEFPNGLPSIPPKKQKTKLSEVEQQLKKAEAAQRRRMQSEKAAREAEAEAIRKIRGQDSGRKKKEEKMRKQRDEVVQAKAAKADAIGPNTVRWVIGPTGTTVIFSDDIGLPRIFNSLPCSYPPPREKCAGPNCTNAYKYRDSKSKLPLCSLHCYKAIHGKMQPLITC